MEGINCPNSASCQLIIRAGFTGDELLRSAYIRSYCEAPDQYWANCNRFVIKNALNFCPDFVLPDSSLTPDEVIARFDKELEGNPDQ